jgi:flagellar biosynthesis/type III secretory pathway M-ring protein FliF/YscJ
LDGGYALVYLAEGITHKLPTEKWLNIAANVGLYILILLVVYASYSDIKRIFFKPKAAVEEVQAAPEQPQTAEEQTAENSNSTEENYVQE